MASKRQFPSTCQRRYTLLLLRPVCRFFCAVRQLFLIFVASHQKHIPRGTELILLSDAWYWPIRASAGGSYSGLIIKTSKLADLNQDDSLKLSQLQNVLLLLLAFSSPSNTVASTPAAKQHQIIISIRRLAGWSHSDDLSSHLETLPYMEQHKLNFSVCVCHCVLLLCKYRRWYCVSVTLPVLSPGTNTWCRIFNPHQHVIGQTWLTWTPHDAVVLGLLSFTYMMLLFWVYSVSLNCGTTYQTTPWKQKRIMLFGTVFGAQSQGLHVWPIYMYVSCRAGICGIASHMVWDESCWT